MAEPELTKEQIDKINASVPNGDSVDPATVIPVEAAKAHLRHWWREPVAGLISIGIAIFDIWHFGREGGLTASLDEILVISGVVLVAGSKRLFGSMPMPTKSMPIPTPTQEIKK